jgi:starch synthase
MKLGFARSVLVVHNISHQGRSPPDDVRRLGLPDHHQGAFYLDDPQEGACMNVLKAGIEYATKVRVDFPNPDTLFAHTGLTLSFIHRKVIAVSPGYAWEIGTDEGGWGLANTIRNAQGKVSGIVNGIDFNEWDPQHDKYLTGDGYQTFGLNHEGYWTGKQACKAALQRQLGLPERHDVPILAFIGRLDHQKGVDLILNSEDFFAHNDVQVVFLGSGRGDLQDQLMGMQERHRDKVRAWIGFSNQFAHRLTAGADILMMPSRFEPCGLNQLYAMHYGTVPVVHEVGGLRDTVRHYDGTNDGTGWKFERAEADKFRWVLGQAVNTYFSHRDAFVGVAVRCVFPTEHTPPPCLRVPVTDTFLFSIRGMQQDLGWDHAAFEYEQKLIEAKYAH